MKQITVTGALGELGASAARIVIKENTTARESVCLNHLKVRLSDSPAREAATDMRNPATSTSLVSVSNKLAIF